MSALGTLDTYGPITPSELAVRERLARPGVTRMIARLHEQGLVSHEDDPLDGRSYKVRVTRSGEVLLKRSRQRRTRFLSRALRGLDEREVAVLAEAVALLERIIDDER
jgi:DNA-binding MarR family transcriptional regulator